MDIEREKVPFSVIPIRKSKNDYQVIVSGIGRESTAKAMMNLPSTMCVC